LPLAIGFTTFTLLMTWNKGREIVTVNRGVAERSLADFVEELGARDFPVRLVPGVGVFLFRDLRSTPPALRANVEHNHVLHDQVIVVSVEIERVSHVPEAERVLSPTRILYSGATGDPLGPPADRISTLTLRFGFLDEPDVPSALRRAAEQHLIEGVPNVDQAAYFVSQTTIVPTKASGMHAWRKKFFVAMSRNAANPAEYFRLPDDQTVTMSGRIQI
jgi:KUP system potassium uptake protein